MKTFKIFEKGIETVIEADNIVTMEDGSYRLYKDRRLIACLCSTSNWIEIDGNEKKNKDEE